MDKRWLIGPHLRDAPAFHRYVLAIALFVFTLLVRLQLRPWLGDESPLLAFVFPVLVSAFVCGRGPALVVTVLAPLAATPIFHSQFDWAHPLGWLAHVVFFAMVSLVAVGLIHQLQRSHRELRASEAKVRLAVEAGGLEVVDWLLQPRADGQLGLNAADVKVAEIFERFHSDDREQLLSRFRALTTARDRIASTARLKSMEEWRDVELVGTARQQPAGNVHFTGVLRDITEQRQSGQRDALLSSIFDSSGDAIISEDVEGCITSWNRASQALFGYSADEMIGQPSARLFSSDTEAIQPLRIGTREVRCTRKDGTELPVAQTLSVITDRSGQELGYCRILRDVTEQLRAREELVRSELRFRQLADAMPQIVYVLDTTRNVVYLNKRWQEFTGHAEAKQSDLEALIPAEDVQKLYAAFDDNAPKKKEHSLEFRLRSRDGELRWFLRRSAPIMNADGSVDMWVGTSTDIHDQKLAQTALLEADRRKNEFLAMLAHELRNPLAPIMNIASILEARAGDATAVHQMTGILKRQSTHLARLIDDLLDVSRITRGKINLQRDRVVLQDVLDRALETVHPVLIAKSQAVKLSAPARSVGVDGDLVRLTQVVANLLANAAKFSPRDSAIHLTLEHEEQRACIRVRDHGVGIDPQTLPHVFELFMQADQSLDRSQGGLGIGLTIAQRLVELHGGTLQAFSEGLGKGAEFVVMLPLATASSAGLMLPADRPRSGQRILIVDDNQDAAMSLLMLLETDGHEVRIAHDGARCLELLEQAPADVAFLDIGLPGLDGYALAELVRQRFGASAPRLVAVSGYAPEEGDRADPRFDAHLIKPVQQQRLVSTLAHLFGDAPPART